MNISIEYVKRKIAQLLIISLLFYSIELSLMVTYATPLSDIELENDEIELLTDDSEDEVVKEYRYNIDVSWGRMTFVYDRGVWDTDEMKYKAEEIYPSKETVDGEPGWYKFDGVNNKISVINVSTINPCEFDLWVDNNVRSDTEDYEEIDKVSEVSGIIMEFYENSDFIGDSFTSAERIYIEKATEIEEKEVSYYLNIDGEPVGLGEIRTELGSVVIQVHKPEVETSAAVAMSIEAEDEVLAGTFDIVRFDLKDLLADNYGLEERVGPGMDMDEDIATDSNASMSTFSLRRVSQDNYNINIATDSNATMMDSKSVTKDEVAVKLTIPNYLKHNLLDIYTTVGEYDEDKGLWILGEGETSGTLELMFEYNKEATYTIKARAGHINENGKFKLGLSEESSDEIEDNVAIKEIKVIEEFVATPSNATPSNATPSELDEDENIDNNKDKTSSSSNASKQDIEIDIEKKEIDFDLNDMEDDIKSNDMKSDDIIFKKDDESE